MRASTSFSKGGDGQIETGDGVEKGAGDGVAFALGAAGAVDHLGPPAGANLAGQRIGDEVADARHLGGKGIERIEMRAAAIGGPQAGEPAVAIVAAHLVGDVDIGGGEVGGVCGGHID